MGPRGAHNSDNLQKQVYNTITFCIELFRSREAYTYIDLTITEPTLAHRTTILDMECYLPRTGQLWEVTITTKAR